AARLTQQLLAFGRKQVLQPRRVSLNQLVREAMSGLAPMLKPRITVVEQLAPDDPHVLVDRQQFQHVFLNVLLNALEAMPDGGTLTLNTSQEPFAPAEGDSGAPGRYGVLRIRDTGAGMDAGTLERAFEPFFTTKPVGEGLGLGLSISYGIVQNLGGTIRAENLAGGGACFTVELPLPAPQPLESA
ncbi:MAG TPA: ATP-binding protein, partial [Plasticicumulans sp.]|nr:ATP-binding protein [Plasticicumulans sp.]